jgi:DNA-binding transcriptional LysR family regulator
MELRVLNYFLMVAREENITRASQLLHVTQPTLSRQLMQLEAELGVKLFERSSHSIVLTDAGMLLKRRAQELVSLADKTQREFAQNDGPLNGELTLGCGELRSVGFIVRLLGAFRIAHPLVHFDMYSGNADNIKDRIERGSLDLGLLLEPVDIGRYEFLRLPVKETWGVLVREDSELALKERVTPQDLAGVPLMMSKRALVRNELASWFGEFYDKLEIMMSYNLVYNAAVMASANGGAVLCLELDSTYEHLRFIPLFPKLEAGSVLAWKKNQIFSPVATAFIEYVKECVKGISDNTK